MAIEALGTQQTFESALRTLRPGGTLSSLGVYSGKLELPYEAFAAGLGDHRIVTTLCPGGKERMGRLIAMVQAGRFDPTPLLTHRFRAERDRGGLPGLQQPTRRRAEGRNHPVAKPSATGRPAGPASRVSVGNESIWDWAAMTGRRYGLIDGYRCEDADDILVAMAARIVTHRRCRAR